MEAKQSMNLSRCIHIQEANQVGEARRLITGYAAEIGLPEPLRGQISIIVTELAGNLAKHTTKGGQLVYRKLNPDQESVGLDILSLDRGPGMQDVGRCLQDGYSTAGSPGTGLGAVERLSTSFDIYSTLELGTAILSRVAMAQSNGFKSGKPLFIVGAVCLPISGETVSGDGWAVAPELERESFLIADGLGHGPEACHAAERAIVAFYKNKDLNSNEVVNRIHLALKSTRGAAVAIAQIDPKKSVVHYSGVGNTVGIVFSQNGHQRRMV